jgi:hypothetical protein
VALLRYADLGTIATPTKMAHTMKRKGPPTSTMVWWVWPREW